MEMKRMNKKRIWESMDHLKRSLWCFWVDVDTFMMNNRKKLLLILKMLQICLLAGILHALKK